MSTLSLGTGKLTVDLWITGSTANEFDAARALGSATRLIGARSDAMTVQLTEKPRNDGARVVIASMAY
jgi:hypothetical protein